METIIPSDNRIAIAEVDYIIHHMNKKYLDKIPQKVKDCITILKEKNVKINIDPNIPLEKQDLNEFTLYFLMILNLKYWCDDKKRKDLLLILENNQKKYNEKSKSIINENKDLSLKENVIVMRTPTCLNEERENISFEDVKYLQDKQEAILEIKEDNFFIKLINKIKSFFVMK